MNSNSRKISESKTLFIKDPTQRAEFDKFIEKTGMQPDVLIISNTTVAVVVIYSIITFVSNMSSGENNSKYNYFVKISFIISILVWMARNIAGYKNFNHYKIKLIDFIGMFLITFTIEVTMINRMLNGRCKNAYDRQQWMCNSESDISKIPSDNMVMLMMLPILFSIIFRSRFSETILIWFSILVTFLVSIIIGSSTSSIFTVSLYVPVSIVLLIEIRRQHLSYFFRYQEAELFLLKIES
jgi:hypothetical protein